MFDTSLHIVSLTGLLPYAIALLIFAMVFALTLFVAQQVHRREEIKKRAHTRSGIDQDAHPIFDHAMADLSASRQKEEDDAPQIEAMIERSLALQSGAQVSPALRDLTLAGYFGKNAVFWFFAARVATAIALPVLLLGALKLFSVNLAFHILITFLFCAAILGLILPSFYLDVKKRALQSQCRNGFPDFMDLLVVCAEAGQSPRAAIDRISRELSSSYPFLSANLYLMSLELRVGRPLVEAAENLGRRIGIDEVKSLGSLLKQTEELGTSLTDALRVYSEEMRDKRMSRAEEKAHALPVKMVVPLGVYVFPVVMIVVMLPVVVRIKNALF